MLSSLEDLEAAFFHNAEPQPAAAARVSHKPSVPAPSVRTTAPPSPSCADSHRSPSSVFTIRPLLFLLVALLCRLLSSSATYHFPAQGPPS